MRGGADIVVAGDAALLTGTAAALGIPLTVERYDPSKPPGPHRAGVLKIMHVPLAQPVTAGELDPRNAPLRD